MKSFNRILAILLCILFTLPLGSCSASNQENELIDGDVSMLPLINNEILTIYDINNNVIGEIEHYGMIIQTEDSIVYTQLPDGSTDSIDEMAYYRYVLDTKENIKLGTVKNWSYQNSNKVYVNDRLYFFVATDVNDSQERTLKFCEVDFKSNTMREIFSDKGGFPYNAMALVGNHKIIYTKILENETRLMEYNVETEENTLLKSFAFDDDGLKGETIRQVSSDENTISLLVLAMQSEDQVALRIDRYDHDMNYITSIDVTSLSSDPNELRQGVGYFQVYHDYVYYENFSISRFLGRMEEDALKQVAETDYNFSLISSAFNNFDKTLFYQAYTKNNDIYCLDYADGTLKKTQFHAPDEERYSLVNAYTDQNNHLALVMSYRDPDTAEFLEPRLYYIKLSDLEFSA